MERRGLELSTLIGLGIGVGALIVGFMIEGGNLLAFIHPSAILIIIGGTIGATMVSFGLKEVLRIPKLFMDTMRPAKRITPGFADILIEYAEKSRRDGILSLEEVVDNLEDKFLKKGMQLVIDGCDPDTIISMLENDIYVFETKKKEEAAIFDEAGGFSPTFGIIGTVMGLILVLERVGGDPTTLGPAIAVAFVATFWGISLANLLWLPIRNKLKGKIKEEKMFMELVMIAVLSIQNGENPTVLRRKIENYFGKDIEALKDKYEGG
jgi:chemotaxis protein MotA